MRLLYELGSLSCSALILVFACCAVMQTMHVLCIRDLRKHQKSGVMIQGYETILVVHLALNVLLVHGAYKGLAGFSVRLWSLGASLVPALYLNVLFVCLALAALARFRNAFMLFDALAMLCVFPPVMEVLDARVLLCVNALWFLFRCVFMNRRDADVRKERLSAHCVNDAMMELPEGVMVAQPSGRVLLLNNSMRQRLLALELPLRLSDAHAIWAALEQQGSPSEDGGIFVRTKSGVDLLFYKSTLEIDEDAFEQYWVYDVTKMMVLSVELELANDQLAQTAEKLREQLQTIDQVAEHEAVLAMKARVHDVTSQRLSILHSLLEAGRTDDASLAELRPLLVTVLEDLAVSNDAPAPVDIDALKQAFSLIGVEIAIHGTLPNDQKIRLAFANAVREATTNAVRHAQATVVDVEFEENPQYFSMTITNNGKPAGRVHEGNGMKGMRRRIERVGGDFCVVAANPFTLYARVPRESEAQ